VVEIGCGHGNFTNLLLDCATDFVGATDLDASSLTIVRDRSGDDIRLKTKLHDVCEPVDDELRDWRADTIVSVNVLEHIQDDLLALRHMGEILVPGGRVLLIVPAHPWAYGTMDRCLGHYRRYTAASLRRLFREAGLTVVTQRHLNVLGLLGWVVNGSLLRKCVPPEGQLRMLNQVIPILRHLERILRPPLGISLLTVGTSAVRQ
jgi:SAM-dependent methyltransferase